jgi:hypothetical protein
MSGSVNDQLVSFLAAIVDGSVTLSGSLPTAAGIPATQQSTSLSDTNVITSPASNAVLATITVPATGTYQVEVNSFVGGTTVATTEINNMRLRVGGTAVGRVINPVPGTAGGVGNGSKRARISATSGQVIDVIAVAAGTTGAIYGVDLVASRIS